MCLIAIKPIGLSLPKEEHLRFGEKRNNDGMGVAIWKDGTQEVHIKKDFLKIDDLLAYLRENVTEKDICVVHFRLATHGLKDIGNRHPFPITRNGELLRKPEISCQFAAAHNGVLREYGIHQTYSDTQKFIMDILADDTIKNNLDNKTVRKLILNFIDGDRLVILDKDGKLYTFGNFENEGGILYSNSFYKPWVQSVWSENNYDDYNDGFSRNGGWLNNKMPKLPKLSPQQKENIFYTCDCCDEKTWVKFVNDANQDGSGMYLCKKCRKLRKKGKLKTFAEVTEDKTETIQCDGCLKWAEKTDITEREGTHICSDCMRTLIS